MSAAALDPRMRNFVALDHSEQLTAIKQLATSGMGDYAIAAATRLSIEEVRRVLATHSLPLTCPPKAPVLPATALQRTAWGMVAAMKEPMTMDELWLEAGT